MENVRLLRRIEHIDRMAEPKIILCLALVLSGVFLCCSAGSSRASPGPASSTNDWQTKTIASEANLDRVIGQLQTPTTRFDAFLSLLEFAGYPKGNIHTHDLTVNALHEKAINAMQACPELDAVIATMIGRLKKPNERLPMLRALLEFSGGLGGVPGFSPHSPLEKLMAKAEQAVNEALDVPTVEKALVDSNWLLRITAVHHFGNPPAQTNEWKRLLPRMEKLAVDDDAAIRAAADGKLQWFPGTEMFLDERLTNETSADVILELLRDRYYVGNEFINRFLALFLPLLSHPDEKVREDALLFVGFNSQRAPVLQFPFGMDVFDRVIASSQAKSPQERAAAAYALNDIRQLDTDRSREAFLRLANDPDEDVRWRVAWGLNNQLEREDVKRAIADLVKDSSPCVKYEAILVTGPQKVIPELEALSKGADPYYARLAAQELRQLAKEKKN